MSHVAGSIYEEAAKLVDSAKSLLNEVEEVVKAGLEIAEQKLKEGLSALIDVKSVCFKSSLEAASKFSVTFKVEVAVLKSDPKSLEIAGTLESDLPKQIAEKVIEQVYKGWNLMKSGMDRIKESIGKFDSHIKELDEQFVKGKNEFQKDEGGNKRNVIWTKQEKYFRKLAYEDLRRNVLKDDATLAAFERFSSYSVAAGDNPMARAAIPHFNRTTPNIGAKRETILGKDQFTHVTEVHCEKALGEKSSVCTKLN